MRFIELTKRHGFRSDATSDPVWVNVDTITELSPVRDEPGLSGTHVMFTMGAGITVNELPLEILAQIAELDA